MPEPRKLPLSLLAFMPYNIPIIIYFRRDARCSAKSHGSWCADCCPGAWRRATRGATAVCWPRRAAWPTAGRRRSAQRALCAAGPGWCIWPASSLLSSWCFPARRNAAPAAAARRPTGASTRRTPTRCAAGSRTGTPFCWPGPGWGRAPPMSVRPCSAGTPRGPVPCWMPTH